MMMNVQRRLILMVMTLAVFVFVGGVAVAGAPVKAHHHNSGHALVASKLKTNGTHQLEKKGKHTVSAEVRNGKIAGFHVKHDTKGDIAVKKYRTNKKMASLELDLPEPPSMPAQTDLGTAYIAYAYVDDDGNEEYYWFPVEEILDADTGAIDYVPLS
jgi:hypothetical protein